MSTPTRPTIYVPSAREFRPTRSAAEILRETFAMARNGDVITQISGMSAAAPPAAPTSAPNQRKPRPSRARFTPEERKARRAATIRETTRLRKERFDEVKLKATAAKEAEARARAAKEAAKEARRVAYNARRRAQRLAKKTQLERLQKLTTTLQKLRASIRERRARARQADQFSIGSPEVVESASQNVARGTDIKIRFRNFTTADPEHEDRIMRAVTAVLESSAPPGARLQLVFSLNGDEGGHSFSTKMTSDHAQLAIHFNGLLEKMVQSDHDVAGDGYVTVKIRPVSGGSGGLFVPDFLTKGYGVTIIRNEDNSCGLRCLVLGVVPDVKRRNLLKKAREGQLTKEVDKLAAEIGQDPTDPMTFTDFDKFTAKYPDYQVVFLSKGPQGVVFTYETEALVENPTKLNIFWDSEQAHYHLIHDVHKFTNDRWYNYKWCAHCHKSILKVNYANHKCVGSNVKCRCCTTRFSCAEDLETHMAPKEWRNCGVCNMPMVSDECEAAHVCDGKSWRCSGCKKWIPAEHKEAHVCGEKHCEACGEYFTGEHRCFIKKIENAEKHDNPQVWVYDFESRMIESEHGSTHEVDTVVAMKLYSEAPEDTKTFTNIQDFVRWAMEQTRTTFIAHNARSYDGWLVWQHLIKNTHERPGTLVLAGNKVMMMTYKSNKFIDSLSHVASSLEGLPKVFGLDPNQFKKGFFPYRFNTPENAGYVGAIPDMEWYDPHMMKSQKRADFLEWYAEQEGVEFDLDKERHEYCVSDVLILKKAMETYRDLCIDTFKLDPLKCVTIASFAMKNFRTNFMEEENLAVLTKDEYAFIKRAFCGGRTNAAKLYRKWSKEELEEGVCGRKIDIQSLYPTTQFYDTIPVGAPKWEEREEELKTKGAMKSYIDSHFGFIECDVDCPPQDFFPSLPEKKEGKLIFDLTPKRKMVFTSAELGRAVEKGYRVSRVYKSLVFEKSTSVFKQYVATLLKGKVEASGMPKADLPEFIAEHERRFGFTLDPTKMVRNEGLRSLYKICLNALWGKMAEKFDRKEDKYCTTEAQWFTLMSKHVKGEVEITGSWIIGSSIHAQFKQLNEKKTALARTNLAVAAFVTSNARLRLGAKLDDLGPRAFYFDTDSILYHYDPKLPNVEEGEYLGDWEKENANPIVEFCAMGPKSYAVREADERAETKMKGFTLHHANAAKVNLDSMKKLVDGKITHIEGDHLNFIKKDGGIHTRVEPKSAVFSYTKRRLVGNYNTVPMGWAGELPAFV